MENLKMWLTTGIWKRAQGWFG